MSDIKTKKNVKDIKVLDKSAMALRKMKRATVRTKDQIENLIDDGQVTPSEYAEDQIKYAAEDTADSGVSHGHCKHHNISRRPFFVPLRRNPDG